MAVGVSQVVALEYPSLLMEVHLRGVATGPLRVTTVVVSMLLTILVFTGRAIRVGLMAPSMVATALLRGEEALRRLVLPREAHTCSRLVHLTVASHASKAGAVTMRAIHRRPLDLHRLGPPLLVRVGGLAWRLRILEATSHTDWALRLLAAASEIATSVGKDLVIIEDLVHRIVSLLPIHSL